MANHMINAEEKTKLIIANTNQMSITLENTSCHLSNPCTFELTRPEIKSLKSYISI